MAKPPQAPATSGSSPFSSSPLRLQPPQLQPLQAPTMPSTRLELQLKVNPPFQKLLLSKCVCPVTENVTKTEVVIVVGLSGKLSLLGLTRPEKGTFIILAPGSHRHGARQPALGSGAFCQVGYRNKTTGSTPTETWGWLSSV